MLTARGSAAFAVERWDEAEVLYLAALAEADALFRAFSAGRFVGRAEPAPMLVVATANLAECLLCSGQLERAGRHLVELSRTLCDVIDREEAPFSVREQCFVHLRPAVIELVEKLPRAGWDQDASAREVERAKSVALGFLAEHTPKN